MTNLADIRKTYAQRALSEADAHPDALVQFQHWLDEALHAQLDEPTAMLLSTVDGDGTPAGRVVLLKNLQTGAPGGFTFYTNYESRKGRALTANPRAALTFFWPGLERQVRIEGVVERTAAAVADAYFQSRPRASQIGAWASPQSAEIDGRATLEAREAEIAARFADVEPLPRPPFWGGFTLRPHRIEFWQGRPSRLHDRLRYERAHNGDTWTRTRLAP